MFRNFSPPRSKPKPASVRAGPLRAHGALRNIRDGCNSVLATRMASSWVTTPSRGGLRLRSGRREIPEHQGASGRRVAARHRAGGHLARAQDARRRTGEERGRANREALARGIAHLEKHIENAGAYGLTPIVAINVFPTTPRRSSAWSTSSRQAGRAHGQERRLLARRGRALDLARTVIEVVDATDAAPPAPKYVYELEDAPEEKIRKIARTSTARKTWLSWAAPTRISSASANLGYEKLPVCMAKDAAVAHRRSRDLRPAARLVVSVREVRLSAGAGFLVPLTGDMMTMPGLPKGAGRAPGEAAAEWADQRLDAERLRQRNKIEKAQTTRHRPGLSPPPLEIRDSRDEEGELFQSSCSGAGGGLVLRLEACAVALALGAVRFARFFSRERGT